LAAGAEIVFEIGIGERQSKKANWAPEGRAVWDHFMTSAQKNNIAILRRAEDFVMNLLKPIKFHVRARKRIRIVSQHLGSDHTMRRNGI
jgi:hypothetical protein